MNVANLSVGLYLKSGAFSKGMHAAAAPVQAPSARGSGVDRG